MIERAMTERNVVPSGRLSGDVIEWSVRAGFACAPIEGGDGVMFWSDPHGQSRIYLRTDAEWITVTAADRECDEGYILSTPSAGWRAVECYLFDYFGSIIRDAAQLPVLEFPMGRLAPGFHKADGPAGFIELFDGAHLIARTRRGLLGSMHLAVISQLLTAEVGDIRASYLSASGLPLFGVRPSPVS